MNDREGRSRAASAFDAVGAGYESPKGGAPEKWPRRRVVDEIRYIVDNQAKWRALPADFGFCWRTVFGYLAHWAKTGVLNRVLDRLRLRLRGSRCPWPVRVIIDARSVKGAESVAKAAHGFDAGKMTNGRKRHLMVDQDGVLVDLLVTPADVQERAAARVLLTRLHAPSTPTSSWSGPTTPVGERSSSPGCRTTAA